jgi:hypothetical protein
MCVCSWVCVREREELGALNFDRYWRESQYLQHVGLVIQLQATVFLTNLVLRISTGLNTELIHPFLQTTKLAIPNESNSNSTTQSRHSIIQWTPITFAVESGLLNGFKIGWNVEHLKQGFLIWSCQYFPLRYYNLRWTSRLCRMTVPLLWRFIRKVKHEVPQAAEKLLATCRQR